MSLRTVFATLACLSLFACAAPPEGTYTMSVYLTSGNCPPGKGQTQKLTVKKTGGTGYIMEFPGVAGSCPLAEADDGTYVSDCDVKTVGGSTGNILWRIDFTSDGFTGGTTERYTGGSDACAGTYDLRATRD